MLRRPHRQLVTTLLRVLQQLPHTSHTDKDNERVESSTSVQGVRGSQGHIRNKWVYLFELFRLFAPVLLSLPLLWPRPIRLFLTQTYPQHTKDQYRTRKLGALTALAALTPALHASKWLSDGVRLCTRLSTHIMIYNCNTYP